LGHIVCATGVAIDPERITALSALPMPTTVKQLRKFLGICNYMRQYVKGFAHIAAPLTPLLSAKESSVALSETQQSAFRELKEALTAAPMLCYADYATDNN